MDIDYARRRIHAHRTSLGLSPEDYGPRIGVTGKTVRRVESGHKPFLNTQKKFAAALNMVYTDLFGEPALPLHYEEAQLRKQMGLEPQLELSRSRSRVAA